MASTVEFREIRVFLALAEELHFGRTADRLELTASRVSQVIRALESKLGGRLVSRTSRHVALTGFGEQFLARVGPAYEELATLLGEIEASNRSVEGTLHLGLLSASSGGPHLTPIVKAFEQLYPKCEVQVSEVFFNDPLGPLRRGEIE